MQAISIFRENPFLRFLVPLILGICFQYINPDSKLNAYLTSSLAITFILFVIFLINRSYVKRMLPGIIIFQILFCLGMLVCNLRTSHYPLHPVNKTYQGIIIQTPLLKARSYQVDCKLMSVNSSDTLFFIRENVRLYFPKDSSFHSCQIGDSIFFIGELTPIHNRGNPGEFDYAAYLLMEGYKYTAFIKTGNYYLGGNSGLFRIKRLASTTQQRLISKFTDFGIIGDELAVLSALSAGDRSMIDSELKQKYSSAGAMHILAVSGLHIGILFLFLNLMFTRHILNIYYRIFRLLIILICLWYYAFITGLPTSVLRATIMFSIFLIGKSFNRQGGSYNLLAASAFIILLINPMELFRAGFQFSYLAVLGILFFQPRLESIIKPPKWAIFNKIWQLVTVSISAQLLTFPLTLFYFNQFPTYFLLTNIIVIPMVWLIVLCSVVFMLLSGVVILGEGISFILNLLLKWNNLGIDMISRLPGSSLSNIHFNPPQLILTFFLIIGICYCFISAKKKTILWLFGIFCIAFLVTDIIEYRFYNSKQELIVYNTSLNPCISLINGMQHILIVGDVDSEDYQKKITYLKPYWNSRKILGSSSQISYKKHYSEFKDFDDVEIIHQENRLNIRYEDIYVEQLRPYPPLEFLNDIPTVSNTILLIDRKSDFPSKYKLSEYRGCKMVFSPSLTAYRINIWKEAAEKHQISAHNLDDEGALSILVN